MKEQIKIEDLIKGEWYFIECFYKWLIKFDKIEIHEIVTLKVFDYEQREDYSMLKNKNFKINNLESITKATKEEVLKYFPDEKFEEELPEYIKCINIINKYSNLKLDLIYKTDGISDYLDCYKLLDMGNYSKSQFEISSKEAYKAQFEEEFVLPELWKLKIPENFNDKNLLNNWKLKQECNNDLFENEQYTYVDCDSSGFQNENSRQGFTKITFEQFKKYVLKENNNSWEGLLHPNKLNNNTMENKKIIGYKCPYDIIEWKKGDIFVKWNVGANNYHVEGKSRTLPAELVETWEPVYESTEQVISMNSQFDLTIRDKKVYHNKTEDITDFVLGMYDTYKKLQKLGRYTAQIEDITFSKVGCENKKTYLSDWLEVYNLIK